MKDIFSTQSDKYLIFRPTYPTVFYDFLNAIVEQKQNAWDCGTGNGQVANQLSKSFQHVFASDISQQQLNNAHQQHNILYSVQPAEFTNYQNDFFNLIVVAEAIHWFNFDKFYAEVLRTAKHNAILCVIGYGSFNISKEIDALIDDFYYNTVGNYWDEERKFIEQKYQTIPFPFEEIQKPEFSINVDWTLEHLTGYINTWSAVKHFINKNNFNPVEELKTKLEKIWTKESVRPTNFPLFLRVGRVKK